MVTMEEVVNKVQQFRKEKKVTQEDFAEAIGVTRQTIISIEKGNYTPSVALALKISEYFGVQVSDIFSIKRK